MRSFSSTEFAEERFFSEGAVLFRYGLLVEGSVLSMAEVEEVFLAQSALKHMVSPHIGFNKLHGETGSRRFNIDNTPHAELG